MNHYLKYNVSEIAHLEGNENYTNIYLASGELLLSSYTLRRHEEQLKDFIRVNRSYLINPLFIKLYVLDRNNPHIVLKSGKRINIPRRKVGEFIELINKNDKLVEI